MAGYPNYLIPAWPQFANPYVTYGANAYSNPYGYGLQPQIPNQFAGPQSQPTQQNAAPGMIKWIKSEKEVDDEYVAPNSAAVLWHSSEPVIYLKEADATGKPSVKVFDLIERIAPQAEEEKAPESASKDEFMQLATAVNDMAKSITGLTNSFNNMSGDLEQIKSDMYGVAGRKKTGKRIEGVDDA